MPFEIRFPPAGAGADAPRRLAKKFVAWGTKDAGQLPLGVLYRAAPDGTPDGGRVVGGVPVLTGRLGDTRWALYFRVPAAGPRERYTLAVLDARPLPGPPAVLGRADVLGFRPHERVGVAPADAGSVRAVDYPLPNSTVSATDFMAYGTLPSGDYDIDPNETYLIYQANQLKVPPLASWPDGTGFWVAVWDVLPQTGLADLHVTYAPSGTDEVIRDLDVV